MTSSWGTVTKIGLLLDQISGHTGVELCQIKCKIKSKFSRVFQHNVYGKKVYRINSRYFGGLLISALADWLQKKKYVSVLWIRRIFNSISQCGPACSMLVSWLYIKNMPLLFGLEPWSSGYGRRLVFWRLWVQIPAPDIWWNFFHIFVWKDEK